MPDLWQRVYSAKDKKALKNGILWSILIYGVVAILMSLLALAIKVIFPDIDPDLALIKGLYLMLPVGLVGLSVVLLFSAIMSSVDTYLFTAASSIVQDFRKENKTNLVKDVRIVIFLLTVVLSLIALFTKSLTTTAFVLVGFTPVVAITTITTWVNKSVKPLILIYGGVIGALMTLSYIIYSFIRYNDLTPMVVIVALIAVLIGLLVGKIADLVNK
ncbi:hypothetical protein KY321_01645 [Candidatus Woesearchaeota archaeon]|nr:hypothetical protein [Candidatus Woesearchaeota archaeon]